MRKTLFSIWWANGTKHIVLINVKEFWKKYGIKPRWEICNYGKRKNGDNCFRFFIHFGYLIFEYSNFNLQGR